MSLRRVGNTLSDSDARTLTVDDETERLSNQRMVVYDLLARRPNAVVSTETLTDGLDGRRSRTYAARGKDIPVHVHHIRAALGRLHSDLILAAQRGVGFVLRAPGDLRVRVIAFTSRQFLALGRAMTIVHRVDPVLACIVMEALP